MTISASSGAAPSAIRVQPFARLTRVSTRRPQTTSRGCARARIGAFMAGVPTQASSPAAGQGAHTPSRAQASTCARKPGARAVKYWAP